MTDKPRLKYEKPKSVDLGRVAPVLGARCSFGSQATDGCVEGFDPNIQSVCLPHGAGATNNCEYGNAANKTCGNGDSPGWGCYSGGDPSKLGSGLLSRNGL
ncbi:hypothetical protein JW823_06330 [bacterium]|nr:hypothetical protein [candidate division CSSED10-310 bacterium]